MIARRRLKRPPRRNAHLTSHRARVPLSKAEIDKAPSKVENDVEAMRVEIEREDKDAEQVEREEDELDPEAEGVAEGSKSNIPPPETRNVRDSNRTRSTKKATTPSKTRSHTSAARVVPDVPNEPDSISLSFLPLYESLPVIDRRSKQTQAIRKERRLILQEEIRSASPSYSDEERATINTLESGVLTGVRRSKRLAFLAHGGGGGLPVFLGVSHVEGAMPEEQAHAEMELEKKVKAG
ncbi:hypothetical protein BU17DRAFT_102389 [Hysterangium stoloniferum]|nr:hypothetical protein BU17DRAFT_102389 [Hysterangium stoloniferum]